MSIHGCREMLSLRGVVEEAENIDALDIADPLEESGIYRLLFAVTHAALRYPERDNPEFPEEWPAEEVLSYLDEWGAKFDLYSDRPFLQAPNIRDTKVVVSEPGDVLKPFSSPGTSKVFFSHGSASIPNPKMARLLLAGSVWGRGGLCGHPVKARGSAASGVLMDTYLTVPMGDTLAETIILNLFPAPELGVPFWENPDAKPSGWLSRLVWPMRAMLLHPSENGEGCVGVQITSSIKAEDIAPIPEHGVLETFSKKKGEFFKVRPSSQRLWTHAGALFGIEGNTRSQVILEAAETGGICAIGVYAYDGTPTGTEGSLSSRTLIPRTDVMTTANGKALNSGAQRVIATASEDVRKANLALRKALRRATELTSGELEAGEFPSEVSFIFQSFLKDVASTTEPEEAYQRFRTRLVEAQQSEYDYRTRGVRTLVLDRSGSWHGAAAGWDSLTWK